jgi:ribonuclease HI
VNFPRKSRLTKFVLSFVPGHAGVKGNERANRFAEPDGLIKKIRSSKECESDTMSRLQEHQVKKV